VPKKGLMLLGPVGHEWTSYWVLTKTQRCAFWGWKWWFWGWKRVSLVLFEVKVADGILKRKVLGWGEEIECEKKVRFPWEREWESNRTEIRNGGHTEVDIMFSTSFCGLSLVQEFGWFGFVLFRIDWLAVIWNG